MSARRLAHPGALGLVAVLAVASCFDDVRRETTIVIIGCADAGSPETAKDTTIIIIGCPDAGAAGTADADAAPETGGGEPEAVDAADAGDAGDAAGDAVDVAAGDTADDAAVDTPIDAVEAGADRAPVPDAAACSALSILPGGAEAKRSASPSICGMTFCQKNPTGPFALNYCCDVGMFAQCRVEHVDLNRFDADHGGKGVLEVSFCLSAAATRSMIHLWYGDYPFRKALPLVGTDAPDIALGPGCYVRYFSPRDALCAAYHPANGLPVSDDMPPIPFPPTCIGPSPQYYTWPCTDGRWTVAGEECRFDYDDTSLWITVENCVGRSESTVSIESVKLLSDDCACTSDSQCIGTGRRRCSAAGVCTDKF